MTRGEAQELGHGLYRVYWQSGGSSLAAVGSNAKGLRWLAPTNWVRISEDTKLNTASWSMVDHVELIEPATNARAK